MSKAKTKLIVLRTLGIVLIVSMVTNLTLMFMGKVDPILFWIHTAFIAVMAFYGLPYLSKL